MEKNKSGRARERRLRAKYRKNLHIAIVACLLIGLAIGFVLGRMTAPAAPSVPAANTVPTPNALSSAAPLQPSSAPAATEPPAVDPNALTLATPVPTPEPEPKEIIVPFNAVQPITVQLHSDGSVRTEDDALAYEELNFSLRVDRYLTTDYYTATYADTYNLKGNETGVQFNLLLNDYMGSLPIDPQACLDIRLENANGEIERGLRLTDVEISRGDDILLTTNVPVTLYKRFKYSAAMGEMKYLVVTTYIDGVPHIYKFELGVPVRPTPEPLPIYNTVTADSKTEEIRKLQQRLIELGFMETGSDDGLYGANTETAIKNAQTAFGMEANGIADNAFQQRIYTEKQ